ncbi:MAG: GNAT family N-acetyltransferase, partial [Myxococcaceae bacterium]
MITFRPAAERDYPSYCEFHALLGVPEPPAATEVWTQRMAPMSQMVDSDGATAAWLMTDRFGPWFFVITLVVGERFQRAGVGRQIMTIAADAARKGGATGWALNVKEDNAGARRLYESLGMKEHSREYVVRLPRSLQLERGQLPIRAANADDLTELEQRFNFLPDQLHHRGTDSLLVASGRTGVADIRGPHGPLRT